MCEPLVCLSTKEMFDFLL
uniref:Uncharacterized protein n=1 Tax=Anguilla anguilla TaxID=7936 RepID=A0A0E9PPD7_ANGAN